MFVFSLSTLLQVLAASAATIPFVAAQFTTDQFNAKITSTAALPGFNVEGGSVFTNFVSALNNKQFFFLATGSWVFEKPESEPPQLSSFYWCSDLTFSDFSNSSLMGYAGRCVHMFLGGYAEMMASGAQVTYEYEKGQYAFTYGISAVFVEQQNVFEGQLHANVDNWVSRYWDDGHKTMPVIGWETHDEGDMAPDAATRSWSGFGGASWISVEEVAQLFNTSADEFTPEKFKQIYMSSWIKEHDEAATIQINTAEAALAIIEQVKNEANSANETLSLSPDQPVTEEDGDTTAAAPTEEVIVDDSGTGRKLTSVAARFVSAALRVFGI